MWYRTFDGSTLPLVRRNTVPHSGPHQSGLTSPHTRPSEGNGLMTDIAPLDKPIPHTELNFALSWRGGHRICCDDTKVKQVPQGLD
jgi:hypothetical protein